MIKSKLFIKTIFFSHFFCLFRFLHEEPERLDYTIKKCKRLTTMLYQLKRVAINQEQKPISMKSQRQFSFGSNGKPIDRKRLLEQIESVTQNSDGRVKAIEVSLLFSIEIKNWFFSIFLEIRKITWTSFTLCKSIRYT